MAEKEKETSKSERGNGPDFTEDNIQKAWNEFIPQCINAASKEMGWSEKITEEFYLWIYDIIIHKGKRGYNNCVIFLAYSREQRNDIASIEMEARDFFKKRFGDKFETTRTQCEYMKYECGSAYISYC